MLERVVRRIDKSLRDHALLEGLDPNAELQDADDQLAASERRTEGLVRIAFKRAFADGTLAVDMDPLSLLCRLATSVPPPRFHTVKYAGVLAPASPWRARIRPQPEPSAQLAEPSAGKPSSHSPCYRRWAEPG